MAKGAYIGVNGIARKIKNCYIGVGGKARKVKKAYIGVNGVAQLCYEASPPLPPIKDLSQVVYRTTPSPGVQVVGGHWAVYALKRLNEFAFGPDFPPSDWFDNYLSEVNNFLGSYDPSTPDPYSIASIVSSCFVLGYPMDDIMAYDLTEYLRDTETVINAGIEVVCYTLIAISMQFQLYAERKIYLDWLVSVQQEDGSFPGDGGIYDEIYMTALVCQAYSLLADEGVGVLPQYVAMADRALSFLSSAQDPDGGYEYTTSIAHTILALTMLGIHPDQDPRFIKSGHTLLDALKARYRPGQGMRLISQDPSIVPEANEWGLAAFGAVELLNEGQLGYWLWY